jgi:hypothetical protein
MPLGPTETLSRDFSFPTLWDVHSFLSKSHLLFHMGTGLEIPMGLGLRTLMGLGLEDLTGLGLENVLAIVQNARIVRLAQVVFAKWERLQNFGKE